MSTRYDPDRLHRRSIGLKGYDYRSAGAYFVTIVTQGQACLFGEVVDGEMRLYDAGRMVEQRWLELHTTFPAVETDAYIIMPNHIHGIIVINGATTGRGATTRVDGATTRVARTDIKLRMGDESHDAVRSIDRATMAVAPTGLGDVVEAFKSVTTVDYIRGVRTCGWAAFDRRLWHRNYYEHVIRNDADLNRIRQYIANNPARWTEDDLHRSPRR